MLKNYIQTTFRSFKKNKGYTSLNILGLAVGFASVLYIAMYISHETSYDSFLPNVQKIFRLSDREYALTSAAHLDHLAENLEQIESKTLVLNSGKMAVGIGDDKIIERNFLYATSDFFNVFEYDLDQGS
ncbi:MAG: ABC transporter permease, partial [Bacteroidota bacterium]